MKAGFHVVRATPEKVTGGVGGGEVTPRAAAFAGVTDCPDLETAVAAAFRWAKPNGIVLLSPAAPSFAQFRDYRDRAEAFARAVRALS